MFHGLWLIIALSYWRQHVPVPCGHGRPRHRVSPVLRSLSVVGLCLAPQDRRPFLHEAGFPQRMALLPLQADRQAPGLSVTGAFYSGNRFASARVNPCPGHPAASGVRTLARPARRMKSSASIPSRSPGIMPEGRYIWISSRLVHMKSASVPLRILYNFLLRSPWTGPSMASSFSPTDNAMAGYSLKSASSFSRWSGWMLSRQNAVRGLAV